jgi:hypothetical protein
LASGAAPTTSRSSLGVSAVVGFILLALRVVVQPLLGSAADVGNYPDFGVGGHWAQQAAGVADVFFADKNIDVFADVALLGGDAVAQRGVEEPEGGEGVG